MLHQAAAKSTALGFARTYGAPRDGRRPAAAATLSARLIAAVLALVSLAAMVIAAAR